MSPEIEAAQLQPTIVIGGIERQRVRYGEEAEDWGADRQPSSWTIGKLLAGKTAGQ